LKSSPLQRFVLDRHERAFRALLPSLGPITRITVVGGGLFPRTAIILRRLLPRATLTIVDASAANLAVASKFLRDEHDDDVVFVQAWHRPDTAIDADLVVLPLAYRGDRRQLYRDPPAAHVIVHDWIWSTSPTSVRVSWVLLKRLNLIRATRAVAKARIAS
jgi:uroporphyrinogen-III synthase